MLYRADDVQDWLSEARSIIRLDESGDMQLIEDEEDRAMRRIMSRYEEDVDNLAYMDDDLDDDVEPEVETPEEDDADWAKSDEPDDSDVDDWDEDEEDDSEEDDEDV